MCVCGGESRSVDISLLFCLKFFVIGGQCLDQEFYGSHSTVLTVRKRSKRFCTKAQNRQGPGQLQHRSASSQPWAIRKTAPESQGFHMVFLLRAQEVELADSAGALGTFCFDWQA